MKVELDLSRFGIDGGSVRYVAARPFERRLGHVGGSAMPFVSWEQAVQGTPTKGEAPVIRGRATIDVPFLPNSYYVGKTLYPPALHAWFRAPDGTQRHVSVVLGQTPVGKRLFYSGDDVRQHVDALFSWESRRDTPATGAERLLGKGLGTDRGWWGPCGVISDPRA